MTDNNKLTERDVDNDIHTTLHNGQWGVGNSKIKIVKILKISFAMSNLYQNVAKYEISARYDI